MAPGIRPAARPSRPMSLRPNTISRTASSSGNILMTTLAVEQVAEIRRRPETGRLKPGDLVRAADIGDHPSPGGHEVSGHRRSHAAKSDKTDFAQRRLAASQLSVTSKLPRQILECTS